MSSANTFGTFLDTYRQLESAGNYGRSGWPEKQVFLIAKTLATSPGGRMPVKETMARANLPQDAFLGALVAGRDKNLFEIDESGDEPILALTKVGRAVAE
jgi:hypothetical protein